MAGETQLLVQESALVSNLQMIDETLLVTESPLMTDLEPVSTPELITDSSSTTDSPPDTGSTVNGATCSLMAFNELKDHWAEMGMELFPHQIECVEKVIREMRGRALLADEVGLGKTIEAGMILKELILRGEVKSYLILVPASLGYQWWYELSNKFKIDIWFNRKGRAILYYDRMIASIDMCKRDSYAPGLIEKGFDMVIVDEAHKLKNRNTLAWKFVNDLPKKYCLFLTATPIHNDLQELYNLVSIINPDIFGS